MTSWIRSNGSRVISQGNYLINVQTLVIVNWTWLKGIFTCINNFVLDRNLLKNLFELRLQSSSKVASMNSLKSLISVSKLSRRYRINPCFRPGAPNANLFLPINRKKKTHVTLRNLRGHFYCIFIYNLKLLAHPLGFLTYPWRYSVGNRCFRL